MTPSEIAETLLNGNVSDAREAILFSPQATSTWPQRRLDSAVLALDVLHELAARRSPEDGEAWVDELTRLRRCLTGGT